MRPSPITWTLAVGRRQNLQKFFMSYHFYGQDGLVSDRELVVQRHDDTVGDDGQDDGPLEHRPVDEPDERTLAN